MRLGSKFGVEAERAYHVYIYIELVEACRLGIVSVEVLVEAGFGGEIDATVGGVPYRRTGDGGVEVACQ